MIPFTAWLPDIAPFQSAASSDVINVVPSTTGFRPFASLVTISGATTARVQGAYSARDITGTIHNFCGDATKLYKLSADGLTWNDVTRLAGGAYATAADSWWDFALFGQNVIATNGFDAVQVYSLAALTNFAALAGTPPVSSFTGTVRDFAILARKSGQWNRITWSAINNSADWVQSSTTMSDFQDFPDGGAIMGFVGGEYGLVFLERRVYRMAFAGPPIIFRFDQLSNSLGCRVERSIASYSDLAFFLSNDGFMMIRGGTEIVPIGNDKVDRTFETLFNSSIPQYCSASIDPIRKLYLFAFPSNNSSSTPDTIYCYHWPTGQWSKAAVTTELIYTAATQSGYTLDTLDTLSGSLDALPYSLDSKFYSGSGRLLLAGFDTTHKQGYFSGANLAATVETGDSQLTVGRKTLLKGLRPMLEGSAVTPSILIKSRDNLTDSYTSSTAVPINSRGYCPLRVNARFHRAQMTIPASTSWTFAQGIDDLKFSPMGAR